MNAVSKTLYIPLYAKASVSRKGLFIADQKAEEIWEKEGFPLKGKASSKWLCYYLGIRAAVFDGWVKEKMDRADAVLHLGCGLDSRVLRIGGDKPWYDVDFAAVIEERKRHFEESESYRMLAGDLGKPDFLKAIPKGGNAAVVMEGVSMYLPPAALQGLFEALAGHFDHVSLLLDAYTSLAARLSRYKNPIHAVGAGQVYGVERPEMLANGGFSFVKAHDMTPPCFIDELQGLQRQIFKKLYAGRFSRRLYQLYEYESK